jgi:SGNH hydrolase-like domain, acetyltransferase AlgX
MTLSSRWQPGQLIPILMVLSLVAEAGTRFLPVASVSTRGTWEGALRYSLAADLEAGRFGHRSGRAGRIESAIDPRDPRQGSFEINLNLENRHAFGNLASVGNLPQYRHYRIEDFVTDGFGFRNRPESSRNGPPDAIVVGSSFIAQPGVVNEETLPAQLAARAGRKVYNAGTSGGDPVVMADFLGLIRRTARRLGMNRGLVINDYKAGDDECIIPPARPDTDGPAPATAAVSPVPDASRPWAAGLRRWLALSRLKIVAQRAYKSLQNDWFLPNVHSKRLLLTRLPTGETMLFQPSRNPNILAINAGPPGLDGTGQLADQGVERTANETAATAALRASLIADAVKYFKWFEKKLARDGLTFVVLFVPRTVAVYGDLVSPQQPALAWEAHYRALQAQLEAEGIVVVNPIPALRREARARLARGEYIYQLDDTHWNAAGIAVAVDEILRVVPSTVWPRALP